MPPRSVTCTNNQRLLLVEEASSSSFSPSAVVATAASTKTMNKRKHPTGTVSFAESVQEHEVTTCLGMSPLQLRAYWYSKYDMVLLQRSTEKIIRKMEQGTFKESSKKTESAVGLFTDDEMTLKTQRKLHARSVVFKEQKSQRRNGISDGDRVATLYTERTLLCRKTALQEGCRAAMEVAANHRKPKRKNLLSRMILLNPTSVTSVNSCCDQSVCSTNTEPTLRSSFSAPSEVLEVCRSPTFKRSLSHSPKSTPVASVKFSVNSLMKHQIAPLD
jgi:hypothetical protein